MTFRQGDNETKIDLVFIADEHRRFFAKCDGNPWGDSTCASGS